MNDKIAKRTTSVQLPMATYLRMRDIAWLDVQKEQGTARGFLGRWLTKAVVEKLTREGHWPLQGSDLRPNLLRPPAMPEARRSVREIARAPDPGAPQKGTIEYALAMADALRDATEGMEINSPEWLRAAGEVHHEWLPERYPPVTEEPLADEVVRQEPAPGSLIEPEETPWDADPNETEGLNAEETETPIV